MSPWLVLVFSAAATFRVGQLVVLDAVIAGTRMKVLDAISDNRLCSDPAFRDLSLWRRKLFELLTCPKCVMGWVAIGTVGVLDAFESVPLPGFMWLTAWTGGIVIWTYTDSE